VGAVILAKDETHHLHFGDWWVPFHLPYDISGDMVTGRNVAVLFIDPSNYQDAVVIAVWT